MPVPAIYDGEDTKAYRQWLSAEGWEGTTSLGGSFVADDIRDYYVTPWELGYERTIDLEHDFVGRDGLLARREDRRRRKVWLIWNDDDVANVIKSSLFDEPPAKYLTAPTPNYSGFNYDAVHAKDGALAGWSGWDGYTPMTYG